MRWDKRSFVFTFAIQISYACARYACAYAYVISVNQAL